MPSFGGSTGPYTGADETLFSPRWFGGRSLRHHSSVIRRRAWLLVPLLAVACARTAEEDSIPFRADALVSGGGGAGGEARPEAARFLFFTLAGQGYLASAAGTEARPICDAVSLRVDAAGERVLCIPASPDAPLLLHDLAATEVIARYPGWRESRLGTPQLSPDGGRVAFPTINEAGKRVVQVRDDGENLVGETRGSAVLGFADERTLLVEAGDTQLWRIGEDPVDLHGSDERPVGPDPAGAVYEVRSPERTVFFMNAEDGRTRSLGPGEIAAVRGRRVLVKGARSGTGVLYDVADGAFSAEVPVPELPLGAVLQMRFASASKVLVEQVRVIACGGSTLRTDLYEVGGDSEVLVDEAGHHVAHIDPRGRTLLVVDVDPCGRPLGGGRVGEVGGALSELEALVPEGPIQSAALSRDGRFVAVTVADGVRVVDLESDVTRTAASGGAGGELHFR